MSIDATFPLALLKPNDRNPRYITEPDFVLLIDSLLGFPEMLDVRGIVYSIEAGNKKGTIYGANQRFRALGVIAEMAPEVLSERITAIVEKAASENRLSVPVPERILHLQTLWSEVQRTKTVPAEWVKDVTGWTDEQREEFTAKDNANYGKWDTDALANRWDAGLLKEWGVPVWDMPAETDYSGKNQEVDVGGFADEMIIKLKYTEDEYRIVRDQLSKIAATPEQAVWKLLGNE